MAVRVLSFFLASVLFLQGCSAIQETAGKASGFFYRALESFKILDKGNKEQEQASPPGLPQEKSLRKPPGKVYDVKGTEAKEHIPRKPGQGIYVKWGSEGTIINQYTYPVKLKKVWIHGSQDRTIAWEKIFDPGADYSEFIEPNAVFEIYSLTGLEIDVIKAPK